MTLQSDPDIRSQEAADWFGRLNQRRISADDVRAFSAWRRDPANAAAYERVQSMWDLSAELRDDPEIAELAARALGQAPRPLPRRRRQAKLGVLGLATLVFAMGGAFFLYSQWRPDAYQAGIGEQRTLTLADGSHVTLDTGSRIEVRLTRGVRAIRLVEGQALFDVAKDPSRPFQVQAGLTRVTALGTRFDVRLSGQGAQVVLVEGRVAVEESSSAGRRWTLAPGQRVNTDAPAPVVQVADMEAATAWTRGRLVFEHTPVISAIAEANRYNTRPLVLEAPGVGQEQISGAFDAGDQDALAAALADLYGLNVSPRSDGALVLSQAPARSGAGA